MTEWVNCNPVCEVLPESDQAACLIERSATDYWVKKAPAPVQGLALFFLHLAQ
ncbi:hypothetical protein HK44_023230 [Pseudomonas fluorescens HK44]|uniref:Uncharacterized protein n=1 Tax=Pseudomonas fluorescens HK44 TaxID=1042209 RepID=A0A010S7G0_PSEFL|nr:hypothetical protein HK44_023230 [Pseudomonas fluorescens HK44]